MFFRNLTDTFLTHDYLVQAGIGPVLLELACFENTIAFNAIGTPCLILYCSTASSQKEAMAFVEGYY